eukprot:2705568-Amphidinium_carterae.1
MKLSAVPSFEHSTVKRTWMEFSALSPSGLSHMPHLKPSGLSSGSMPKREKGGSTSTIVNNLSRKGHGREIVARPT